MVVAKTRLELICERVKSKIRLTNVEGIRDGERLLHFEDSATN